MPVHVITKPARKPVVCMFQIGNKPFVGKEGVAANFYSTMNAVLAEMELGVKIGQSPDGLEKFTLFYGASPLFSNFHCCSFKLRHIQFQNTEQYFHYMKAIHFGDSVSMKRILKSNNPKEQKSFGRVVENFDVKSWDKVCRDHMKQGNLAKYKQNEQLRKRLFISSGTTLVEASSTDCKWGIGLSIDNPEAFNREKWRGSNLLGMILMEIRDELMNMDEYSDQVISVVQ